MHGLVRLWGSEMPVLRNSGDRKYYVYELIDPRDGSVFYVGKGCGARDRSHLSEARRKDFRNPAKVTRIRRIEASGHSVLVRRVHTGLTEAQAYKLEREQIAVYGLKNLTNITRGQNTEIDQWIAIAHDALSEIGYRLRAWLCGVPFTKDDVTWAFRCIRELRESIIHLENERAGVLSKIEEK